VGDLDEDLGQPEDLGVAEAAALLWLGVPATLTYICSDGILRSYRPAGKGVDG